MNLSNFFVEILTTTPPPPLSLSLCIYCAIIIQTKHLCYLVSFCSNPTINLHHLNKTELAFKQTSRNLNSLTEFIMDVLGQTK